MMEKLKPCLYCAKRMVCERDDPDGCFEWRGPQEEGENMSEHPCVDCPEKYDCYNDDKMAKTCTRLKGTEGQEGADK